MNSNQSPFHLLQTSRITSAQLCSILQSTSKQNNGRENTKMYSLCDTLGCCDKVCVTTMGWTVFSEPKILFYPILSRFILGYLSYKYTIIYYTILYYTILYYTILYYTIQSYTILYYTILSQTIVHLLVDSWLSVGYVQPCSMTHLSHMQQLRVSIRDVPPAMPTGFPPRLRIPWEVQIYSMWEYK